MSPDEAVTLRASKRVSQHLVGDADQTVV
jgi:hypothetical protein